MNDFRPPKIGERQRKPERKAVVTYLTREQRVELKQYASECGSTVADVIRAAVEHCTGINLTSS